MSYDLGEFDEKRSCWMQNWLTFFSILFFSLIEIPKIWRLVLLPLPQEVKTRRAGNLQTLRNAYLGMIKILLFKVHAAIYYSVPKAVYTHNISNYWTDTKFRFSFAIWSICYVCLSFHTCARTGVLILLLCDKYPTYKCFSPQILWDPRVLAFQTNEVFFPLYEVM